MARCVSVVGGMTERADAARSLAYILILDQTPAPRPGEGQSCPLGEIGSNSRSERRASKRARSGRRCVAVHLRRSRSLMLSPRQAKSMSSKWSTSRGATRRSGTRRGKSALSWVRSSTPISSSTARVSKRRGRCCALHAREAGQPALFEIAQSRLSLRRRAAPDSCSRQKSPRPSLPASC